VKVKKLSVSIDRRLGEDVRAAAERAGVSVSAWLAEAAAARLRRQALDDFLAKWEAKRGPITPLELARARAELGYGRQGARRA
jgi:hypothetical protein